MSRCVNCPSSLYAAIWLKCFKTYICEGLYLGMTGSLFVCAISFLSSSMHLLPKQVCISKQLIVQLLYLVTNKNIGF